MLVLPDWALAEHFSSTPPALLLFLMVLPINSAAEFHQHLSKALQQPPGQQRVPVGVTSVSLGPREAQRGEQGRQGGPLGLQFPTLSSSLTIHRHCTTQAEAPAARSEGS